MGLFNDCFVDVIDGPKTTFHKIIKRMSRHERILEDRLNFIDETRARRLDRYFALFFLTTYVIFVAIMLG